MQTETNNLSFCTSSEPCVTLSDVSGTPVLKIKTSGLEYNRETYPHETSKQAAERVYQVLTRALHTDAKPGLHLTLAAFGDYPQTTFILSSQGCQHDFNLDLWHWWMIEHLVHLLSKRYK